MSTSGTGTKKSLLFALLSLPPLFFSGCYSLSDAVVVLKPSGDYRVSFLPVGTIGIESAPYGFRPSLMRASGKGYLEVSVHFKRDTFGDFIFLRKMVSILPPFKRIRVDLENFNEAPEVAFALILTELDGSEYEPRIWWERREFRLSFEGKKSLFFDLGEYVLAGYSSDEDGFLNPMEIGEISIKMDDLPDGVDRQVHFRILGIYLEGGDER